MTILFALEKLRICFSKHADWNRFQVNSWMKSEPVALEIGCPYTYNEEIYAQNAVGIVTSTFDRVPFGPDYMNSCLNYLIGCKPADQTQYMPYIINIWHCRFQQIFMSHDEFRLLSNETQRQHFRINFFKNIALVFAMTESCQNGYDQLISSHGQSDIQYIDQFLKHSGKSEKQIRKVGLSDLGAENIPLPSHDAFRFLDLLQQFQMYMVAPLDITHLLLLVCMFSGMDQCVHLVQQYTKLLQRKLIGHFGQDQGNSIFTGYMISLNIVEDLASLLQRMKIS